MQWVLHRRGPETSVLVQPMLNKESNASRVLHLVENPRRHQSTSVVTLAVDFHARCFRDHVEDDRAELARILINCRECQTHQPSLLVHVQRLAPKRTNEFCQREATTFTQSVIVRAEEILCSATTLSQLRSPLKQMGVGLESRDFAGYFPIWQQLGEPPTTTDWEQLQRRWIQPTKP